MSETKQKEVGEGLFAGLLEALADKHSELDIKLQDVSVKLPRMQVGVELNGLVTVTVHLRDLTEEEKKASAARNVGMMTTA